MIDFYRLNTILKGMVSPSQTNPSVYLRYSSLLCSDQRIEVINHTMKVIVAYFVDPLSDLEPLFSDPNSVSSFFLNLCREYPWIICYELSHTDHKHRYQMALIMRSMFSLQLDFNTINICRELFTNQLNNIWQEFQKLFTDSVPQIRIVGIQTIDILLKTQIDERIVTNLIEILCKRFRDLSFFIRKESVEVLESICQSENILNRALMRHFLARVGDKHTEVRGSALRSVSNVFNTIKEKYKKTIDSYFYKLSTACLIPYTTTDREEEKALIEDIFTINLINMRADSSTKMQNLLDLICFSDEIGVRSIAQVFHNQLIMRTLLAKLITSSERHDFKLSIINSNIKVAQSLNKSFEYMDESKQLLLNFHLLLKNYKDLDQMEDNNRITDLINVFMCKTTMSSEKSIDLMEEFFDCRQTVVERQTLIKFKNEVMGRTGIGLIDSMSLIQLFQHMNNIDPKYCIRLASFVILLTKCYTDYFTDETVIRQLLSLPQIILKLVSSESMIEYLKCTESLKQRIKDKLQSIT